MAGSPAEQAGTLYNGIFRADRISGLAAPEPVAWCSRCGSADGYLRAGFPPEISLIIDSEGSIAKGSSNYRTLYSNTSWWSH